MGNKITDVLIYPAGFKIRNKNDAFRFLHMGEDSDFGSRKKPLFWDDEAKDYQLAVINGKAVVLWRFKTQHDIAGYIPACNPVLTIWNCRKVLNHKWFDEGS